MSCHYFAANEQCQSRHNNTPMKMMVGASLNARLNIADTILLDSPNLRRCQSHNPEAIAARIWRQLGRSRQGLHYTGETRSREGMSQGVGSECRTTSTGWPMNGC